jgi:hypothetical protein
MSDSYSRVPDSVEATRDLQDRVGRFAVITLAVAVLMLVAAVSADIAMGRLSTEMWRHGRLVHAAAVLMLLGAWRIARGPALSVRVIEALEAALTIIVCAAWAGLGWGARASDPIEFSIILATAYTLITRSVVVPSSFRRTLAIGLPAAMPTMVFFALRGMPFVAGAPPGRVRMFVVFAILWCLVAVAVSALNSLQLFGLRRHIRQVRRLGQYTLEEKIGEGGMGAVYRATHAMLRRPAAIKLLLPTRTGEKEIARFEREVQLTSRLAHPNTISIFDYGRTDDGVFYYVMEYLDGFDLERLVQEEGPLQAPRAIRILAQVSGALAEAHALGLVHRDIKPANIILTERADEPDVVKVVDFGLVRNIANATDVTLTQADTITGTPMYLAPEAITSIDAIDARADLYALGAVGYFLLTGQHVFEAPTLIELCSKHLMQAPVPPSQRLGRPVAPDLEAVLLRCLAKAPEQRPASAQLLQAALLACADAARYDVAAARSWWRDRGATLRLRPQPARHDGQASTMAIDLHGRFPQGLVEVRAATQHVGAR